ncbi:WD40 repeat domain-containing protein [Streptomyces sp. NBC_00525]|uniref:WD40 repeat domain-containing protein n=1 Tax=Streptomyces sp. NBC_00525 TaxID=2903660 RepID=UPI002E820F58|nr:WD40 repeat domain-containing protein [Streptomyces sp. NBC_00525]WUC95168.1 WD40 repeat domain-containing protein [Streptomyces sp. NBC_00525]
MRSYRLTSSLGAAVLLALAAAPALAADDGGADRSFTIEDPRITESSGLAASRAHAGIYWTHNDSDDGPYVFAVDSRTGKTVATITMKGVGSPRDVEAISLGPDGNLYVGDIGDNLNGSWDHVWIYRFPEPKVLKDATIRATQFDVKYADGPRNAEALMVHPKTGRVYIASKNENGGGLYEGPAKLTAGADNVFRRVGEVPWVTDGAFSPDGRELVLRSYFSARGYAFADGRLGKDYPVESPLLPQSESVTFTADGSALMYGSEGERSDVVRVDVERKDDSGGGGAVHRGDGKATGGSASGEDGVPVKGTTLTGVAVLAGIGLLFVLGRRRRKG